MRNRIINIAVLLAVFIAGVLFFGKFMNSEVTESASDLLDSTLPVVCVKNENYRTGLMYGSAGSMDPMHVRDVLIPMTTEREITLSVKPFGNEINAVSFTVAAPDTGEVIETRKIVNFKEDGEWETASFSLNEPILMNREYPITFTVSTGKGEFNYYARLTMREELIPDRYLQFVDYFYKKCIESPGATELSAYLETDTTVTNTSLAETDITSSVAQITFGNLAPKLVREGIPTIREISPAACTLTNEYLISADFDGTVKYYRVSEFYRLRYGTSRMMLLNFTRTMEQVFDGSDGSITADGIMLGVVPRGVEFSQSPDGSITVFTACGALWAYDEGENTLSLVYASSRAGDVPDEREDHDDFIYRVQRVTDEGNIDFAVIGYMNRGTNEGRTGIAAMKYTSERRFVEETAFIDVNVGFEELKADTDRLFYLAKDGRIFAYLDNTLYRFDPADAQMKAVLTDIVPDCFVSSSTGAMCAWADSMSPTAADTLTVLDLESEKKRTVTAEDGKQLRCVGFINEDFIYGIALSEEITAYPSEEILFPMHEIRIEAFTGERIKTYTPEGMRVVGTKIKEGLVELTRFYKTENGWEIAPADNIMNNRKSQTTAEAASSTDSRTGTAVTLTLPSKRRSLSPMIGSFRMKSLDGGAKFTVQYTFNGSLPSYYVYGGGELLAVLTSPSEATLLADEHVGTVLDSEGRYIYERANRKTKTELANEDIPEAFLSGTFSASQLQAAVPEGVRVLNLSGCSLDMVLYEVSMGRAVAARMADGTATVIVGYDGYNTKLYNFEDGSHYYMGLNDSRASFEAGGNVFVTYVEPQTTVKR